jgi:ribulose-5-phosphate 4-epimerase/fuculose-1-phosphate aldolase
VVWVPIINPLKQTTTMKAKFINGQVCLTKAVTVEVAVPVAEIIDAQMVAAEDMKVHGMLITEADPEELLMLAAIINEHFQGA